VVRPLGDTRPGWKVLRVLGNLLDLTGFEQNSSQEVLSGAGFEIGEDGFVSVAKLSNVASTDLSGPVSSAHAAPCVAPIYQLDGIVRRAVSLQKTADGRQGAGA